MNGSMAHTAHALAVIEFQKVLALVAERTVSSYAAEKVLDLQPGNDIAGISAELNRVECLRSFLRAGDAWQVRSLPDIRPCMRRLAVPGTTLDGAELRAAITILTAGRITSGQFAGQHTAPELRSCLAPRLQALLMDPAIERAVEKAIDDEGGVLDSASSTLRRIRRDLGSHRQQTVKLLEKIVNSLEPHMRVADVSVTVRDGRYVIPVRREARNNVGGIVHGTSGSGATLFMEPPAAIEHGNRIRELEADEQREVDRILLELTEMLRPHHAALRESFESLAEIDSLVARAAYAERYGGVRFEIGARADGFVIRDGRHPLLLAQEVAVVPFTLEMLPGENTLLVSGPNTGGKTVLLKSVALLSAMAQAGIPAPVGSETRLAVFDAFFADVGDEQSIQASLSTFSAHLRNISVILENATADSLVLIDEIGSGTDPIEGAALGAAVLETLTRRGTVTLATTHLGALQTLAGELGGVVNASLEFDARRLQPTYYFVKGIPGRSYGLGIARRLGLPADVIDNAERRVPEGERQVAVLIASLEERERELAVREATALTDSTRIAQQNEQLEERESSLREQQREFEKESRKLARRHLLDARDEVERTIRELKARDAAGVDEAARHARRHIEELAARHDTRIRQLDRPEQGSEAARRPAAIARGDQVRVASLGDREGSVLELRTDSAVVAVGGMKVTVPLSALSAAGAQQKPVDAVSIRGELPDEAVTSEIDLRGMRVDEVEQSLVPMLDAAARADLHFFRIIHGKGTGALRGRVREILSRDPRVSAFRDGAWNEGGIGVTVVEFE